MKNENQTLKFNLNSLFAKKKSPSHDEQRLYKEDVYVFQILFHDVNMQQQKQLIIWHRYAVRESSVLILDISSSSVICFASHFDTHSKASKIKIN